MSMSQKRTSGTLSARQNAKGNGRTYERRLYAAATVPSSVLFSGGLPLFLPTPYISNERRSIIGHHVREEPAGADENADVIGLMAPPAKPPLSHSMLSLAAPEAPPPKPR